jgi:hypothetical protein
MLMNSLLLVSYDTGFATIASTLTSSFIPFLLTANIASIAFTWNSVALLSYPLVQLFHYYYSSWFHGLCIMWGHSL